MQRILQKIDPIALGAKTEMKLSLMQARFAHPRGVYVSKRGVHV